MVAELKINPTNRNQAPERETSTRRVEVDIERLQAFDLGEERLPATETSSRARAQHLREQLLRGPNAALVAFSPEGNPAYVDLLNARVRQGQGILRIDRESGPSLVSLESLKRLFGEGLQRLTTGNRLHVTNDDRGPVINGRYREPTLVAPQELQLVTFQGPGTPPAQPQGPQQPQQQPQPQGPQQQPERITNPARVTQMSNGDITTALTTIADFRNASDREVLGVFLVNGEVLAVPMHVAGRHSQGGFSVTAPREGNVRLTDADRERVRDGLGLAPEVRITASARLNLGRNEQQLTTRFGGENGLHFNGTGAEAPVLGILRRTARPAENPEK